MRNLKAFLSFHSLIYRISYRILENGDDADDIAQEVYIKLWEQRNNLESIRNDEAFVVTLTKTCPLTGSGKITARRHQLLTTKT